MIRTRTLWILCCSLLLTAASWAQTTTRLDDSATVVSTIAPMQWMSPAPGRMASHLLQGKLQVQARLNVQAWIGKPSVRIYMGLAPTPITTLEVRWQTQGRFIPGVLRANAPSSMRALIYQGPITQARLEEVLMLTITADGRTYSQTQQLQFFFDLEL